MQLIVVALSLHVLSATFWAGSTFALARMVGKGSELLFAPQLGAAAVAVATGAYLWLTLHDGPFGISEQLLTAGALCALVAPATQAVVVGGAIKKMLRHGSHDAKARSRVVVAQRFAALLSAVATAAMAPARYA